MAKILLDCYGGDTQKWEASIGSKDSSAVQAPVTKFAMAVCAGASPPRITSLYQSYLYTRRTQQMLGTLQKCTSYKRQNRKVGDHRNTATRWSRRMRRPRCGYSVSGPYGYGPPDPYEHCGCKPRTTKAMVLVLDR
eukprot:1250487-Amphidinium_carterae.1